jgi:gas vesicle protein
MNKDGLANFFLGLGLGVGLGLLFAPKTGEETREILLDKAGEGREFLKKRASELGETAAEMADKGREALNRQRDTLADAIEAGKQAYREKVEPHTNGQTTA